MSPYVRNFVIWGPRLLGLATAAFAGLFAMDAFAEPMPEALLSFAIHLIPAAIVGLMVAIAWQHPWAGAIGFGALALAYAAMVQNRQDWIVAISGPLAVLAVLFAISAAVGRIRPPETNHAAGHRA
jgi:hypothetical protein